MTNTPENLDFACAKAGQSIVDKKLSKDLEKTLIDALAVLEEQGVYALFLFLQVKEKDRDISAELQKFLQNTPKYNPLLKENGVIFPLLQVMAENLDNLLLARDLLRQTLIYARYHAKVNS